MFLLNKKKNIKLPSIKSIFGKLEKLFILAIFLLEQVTTFILHCGWNATCGKEWINSFPSQTRKEAFPYRFHPSLSFVFFFFFQTSKWFLLRNIFNEIIFKENGMSWKDFLGFISYEKSATTGAWVAKNELWINGLRKKKKIVQEVLMFNWEWFQFDQDFIHIKHQKIGKVFSKKCFIINILPSPTWCSCTTITNSYIELSLN